MIYMINVRWATHQLTHSAKELRVVSKKTPLESTTLILNLNKLIYYIISSVNSELVKSCLTTSFQRLLGMPQTLRLFGRSVISHPLTDSCIYGPFYVIKLCKSNIFHLIILDEWHSSIVSMHRMHMI